MVAVLKISTAKVAKSAKKNLKRTFALFATLAVEISSFVVPLGMWPDLKIARSQKWIGP